MILTHTAEGCLVELDADVVADDDAGVYQRLRTALRCNHLVALQVVDAALGCEQQVIELDRRAPTAERDLWIATLRMRSRPEAGCIRQSSVTLETFGAHVSSARRAARSRPSRTLLSARRS